MSVYVLGNQAFNKLRKDVYKMEIEEIRSKEDFLIFLGNLRSSLEKKPSDWHNQTLEDYLESMQAWLEDTNDSFFVKREMPIPTKDTWMIIAGILYAASIYE